MTDHVTSISRAKSTLVYTITGMREEIQLPYLESINDKADV